MGIPVQYLTHNFGRFARTENTLASEITRTGLGLYLSRELLEEHGGRIWFDFTEGAGSTFYLTLP
jgi:signal transduction histidine kinase